MSQAESTTVVGKEDTAVPHAEPRSGDRSPPVDAGSGGSGSGGGGFFKQYKPDQGKVTRMSTFAGIGLLVAWGAKVVHDRLSVIQGEEAWWVWVTGGVPLAFVVLIGGAAWWLVFSHRASGDFMIATEGEMKKVCWSSKNEIIGSTKVVIMFTIMLALTLFAVDAFFQIVFTSIGVLKI